MHDLGGITDSNNDHVAIDSTHNLDGIIDGSNDHDTIVGMNGYY